MQDRVIRSDRVTILFIFRKMDRKQGIALRQWILPNPALASVLSRQRRGQQYEEKRKEWAAGPVPAETRSRQIPVPKMDNSFDQTGYISVTPRSATRSSSMAVSTSPAAAILRAALSATSCISWPEWPLTHSHSIVWRPAALSRRAHQS